MEGRTVEGLMKLLADITGWSDTSLSVKMSYMRARVYTAQDESHLDDNDRGWVVSTTICGASLEVSGQGKTLEAALWNLAKSIPERLKQVSSGLEQRASTAQAKTDAWAREAL